MYKTITVEPTNRTLKSGYTATLRGRQFVEVRPQVSGIITEIKINEGDAVHKGQTLFIIDQVPYKAALETAVANVKSAEAKLATARLSAESKAELFKEQVVSEFDLQTAKNELAEAEAALAQASDLLRCMGATASEAGNGLHGAQRDVVLSIVHLAELARAYVDKSLDCLVTH